VTWIIRADGGLLAGVDLDEDRDVEEDLDWDILMIQTCISWGQTVSNFGCKWQETDCALIGWCLNKDFISQLMRTNATHQSLEEAMQESPGRKPWGDTRCAE
jgi:hypothetical protein